MKYFQKRLPKTLIFRTIYLTPKATEFHIDYGYSRNAGAILQANP